MTVRPTDAPSAALVVDASVLVELVVDGPAVDGAERLLDRYLNDDSLVLVSSAHVLVEAVSALRRFARLGTMEPSRASLAVGWLAELEIILDAPTPRLRRIWELRDRMSAYDAAYAALAEALDSPLVTTDRRLLDACDQAGIRAVHLSDSAPS